MLKWVTKYTWAAFLIKTYVWETLTGGIGVHMRCQNKHKIGFLVATIN